MESTTDQPVHLHGKMEYLHRKKAVGPIAERAFSRILEDNPDFLTIEDKLLQIANENASLKSRFARILRFADVIAAAISPHAGCKHACSSCCHISVGLSGAEAQIIGRAIGVEPATNVSSHGDREALVKHYFGEPCPFLSNGGCSIYDHRPVACRLHFSLDRDGYFCRTSIAPEESIVPNVNLESYWMIYGLIAAQMSRDEGDIRLFFPQGRQC